MDCCNQVTPDFNGEPEVFEANKIIGRRTALKRLAGLAGGVMFVSGRRAYGQGRQVLLAFCGQLLCVIPYEVARARGHFADEGLDVRLVYTRGGNITADHIIIAVDKLNSTITPLADEIFHAQTFMSVSALGPGEQSADERFLTKCS